MKQPSRVILYSLIFILLGLGIYLPSLHYSFQFDDQIHILLNPRLSDFDQYKDISLWKSHLQRPVSGFTFSVSEIWAKGDPAGHRLVNILLHLANAVLVFFLFKNIITLIDKRYCNKRNFALPLALFTAGMFLVHPMQSQSIVYIVQRMNLLSAFFTLSALIFFLQARKRIQNNEHFVSTILFLILAVICAFVGVMSKQNAAVTAILIMLIEVFIFSGKTKIEKVFRIGVLAGIPLVIAVFLFRLDLEGTMHNATTPLRYFISQWPVYLKYIQMYFVPIGQNIDHMIAPYSPPLTAKYIIALIVNLGIIIPAIFGKKFPLLRFGILWFYLAHSIESGFIPIDDIMVDHRNYLPYAGISICLGSLVFFPIRNEKYRLITISVIILIYSVLSFIRVKDWETMETIWQDSIEKAPENKRAWNNLSYAYLNTNPEKAKEAALQALQFDTCYYQAYDNLGAALLNCGDTLNAKTCFINSIKCGPKSNYIAYYNLAICIQDEDKDKAMRFYQRVLDINPNHLPARKQLAILQTRNGKLQEAIQNFKIIQAIEPEKIKNIVNLAIAYHEADMVKQGINILIPLVNESIDYQPAYKVLSNLYGKANELDNAEKVINMAIKRYNDPQDILKRGYIREKAGNLQGAIDDYHYVYAINPSETIEKRIKTCRMQLDQ